MVPGWWVAPAVDRPSQRRGFVLSVLEVQICSWNQPSCQLALTEQRRPMERGLPEAPAQFRSRSGIQQPQPYFLRSEARGPDQRRVLPFLLKIEVRPGLDQRFDEPQFLAFWQHAVEEHVRNVVEWMGSSAPILPPNGSAHWRVPEPLPVCGARPQHRRLQWRFSRRNGVAHRLQRSYLPLLPLFRFGFFLRGVFAGRRTPHQRSSTHYLLIQFPKPLVLRQPLLQGESIQSWHPYGPIEPSGGFAEFEIEVSAGPGQALGSTSSGELVINRLERNAHLAVLLRRALYRGHHFIGRAGP